MNDLYERCVEIRGWHKTGILRGDALRTLAKKYKAMHQDMGTALKMAEEETARELMDWYINLIIQLGANNDNGT